jgi:hypothetical protein
MLDALKIKAEIIALKPEILKAEDSRLHYFDF